MLTIIQIEAIEYAIARGADVGSELVAELLRAYYWAQDEGDSEVGDLEAQIVALRARIESLKAAK